MKSGVDDENRGRRPVFVWGRGRYLLPNWDNYIAPGSPSDCTLQSGGGRPKGQESQRHPKQGLFELRPKKKPSFTGTPKLS